MYEASRSSIVWNIIVTQIVYTVTTASFNCILCTCYKVNLCLCQCYRRFATTLTYMHTHQKKIRYQLRKVTNTMHLSKGWKTNLWLYNVFGKGGRIMTKTSWWVQLHWISNNNPNMNNSCMVVVNVLPIGTNVNIETYLGT